MRQFACIQNFPNDCGDPDEASVCANALNVRRIMQTYSEADKVQATAIGRSLEPSNCNQVTKIQ